MAVRDVMNQPATWVNPISWRDQLPREIAIQRRMQARSGHDHHIYRFYGYRVSMHQRVYRIFNELCNLDHLLNALYFYLGKWFPRHVIWRWQEAHPELRNAKAEDVEKLKKAAWDRFIKDPRHPGSAAEEDGEQDPNFNEWMRIHNLEDHAQADLPEEPKEVVPERFIWTVFDQLVDAFTILATGGEVPENDDMKWKEIFTKMFMRCKSLCTKADGAEGTPVPDFDGFVQYDAHEVCVALSGIL